MTKNPITLRKDPKLGICMVIPGLGRPAKNREEFKEAGWIAEIKKPTVEDPKIRREFIGRPNMKSGEVFAPIDKGKLYETCKDNHHYFFVLAERPKGVTGKTLPAHLVFDSMAMQLTMQIAGYMSHKLTEKPKDFHGLKGEQVGSPKDWMAVINATPTRRKNRSVQSLVVDEIHKQALLPHPPKPKFEKKKKTGGGKANEVEATAVETESTGFEY